MATRQQLRINCPITHEPMEDPVMTPGGHSYERKGIEQWVRQRGRSPLTQEPVRLDQLKPNFALRDAIRGDVEADDDVVPQEDAKIENIGYELEVTMHQEGHATAVQFTPPDNVEGVPVALVLCIDVSGSMNGLVTAKKDGGKEKCDGLTQLDITKHGAITVIQNMRDCDRLAVVTYSDRAKTVFALTSMTKTGKSRDEAAVRGLHTEGMTNMFAGMKTSLDLLKDVKGAFRCVKLLSDGQPNVEPPSGHMNALKRLHENYGGRLPVIDTFGFGYNLDSALMHEISSYTDGNFSFIPDGTMVGTIFINDCANTLTTVAENVTVHVMDDTCEWLGGYPSHDGSSIRLGVVRAGQTKSLWMKAGGKAYICTTYNNFVEDKFSDKIHSLPMTPLQMNQTYRRSHAVDALQKAYNYGLTNSWENAQNALKDHFTADDRKDKYVADLWTDMSVQATQAVSRSDWFAKWGQHYLLSLTDAHRHCRCNNFKDPGVQHYGGKSFAKLRQSGEDVFLGIDTPKPSGRGYENHIVSSHSFTSNYYSSGDPCMSPDTRVHIDENKTISLGDLKKGDTVWTPNGSDTVRCIVRTRNCETSLIPLTDGLRITEWHPVKHKGKWRFPHDLGECEKYKGDIISIVLNKHPSVWLGDDKPLEVICLGHGCQGETVGHPYFGSDAVIKDLQGMRGWDEGLVLLESGCTRTDQSTGLINRMVQ